MDVEECDRQQAALFGCLGQFLYERLRSGDMTYCFQPPDAASSQCAKDLVGVGEGHISGRERRGLLEPYTRLIVDLRVMVQKLGKLREHLHFFDQSPLSKGTDGSATRRAAFQQKIENMIKLIGNKEAVIKSERENVRNSDARNADQRSEEQKDFLENTLNDIRFLSKRIHGLTDEIAGVFKAGNFDPGLGTDQEPETPSVPQIQEENSESLTHSPRVDDEDEEDNYGLLESAERKLVNPAVSDDEKFKILNALFQNMPKKSVSFLRGLIRNTEGASRKQICQGLSRLQNPSLIELYRVFLAEEDSSLRLTGIMGLFKLDPQKARQAFIGKIQDPDPHIRRLIVNFLEYRGDQAEITAIARLSNDPDETVSRVAIQKLGLMSDHFAFMNLVPKLGHTNKEVRKQTIAALEHIAGTDLGYDPAASEKSRKLQEQAWKDLLDQSFLNPRLVPGLRDKFRKMRRTHAEKTEPSPGKPQPTTQPGTKSARTSLKPAQKARNQQPLGPRTSPVSKPKHVQPTASRHATAKKSKDKGSESVKTAKRPKTKEKNRGPKKNRVQGR